MTTTKEININIKFVKENYGKRFNVELSDGTIHKKIAFFEYNGSVCYQNSRQTRRGRLLPYTWDIVKITEVKEKEVSPVRNAKSLANRTHKNAWSNLVDQWKDISNGGEIDLDFKYHFMDRLNYRSMSSLLNDREMNELRNAFKNKTNWSWSRLSYVPQGRDLKIETKLCEDGIFRAWFSSEYYRCGNGDYYLLLSPTTAVYYERD